MSVGPSAAGLLAFWLACGCTLTESLDDLKGGTADASAGDAAGASGGSSGNGGWTSDGSGATGGSSAAAGSSGGGTSGTGGSACSLDQIDCNDDPGDGCETSILTDTSHCGGCNKPCTAPANAAATCSGGVCGFSCVGGYSLCGTVCVNLFSDVSNCGGCGNVCPMNSTCVGGGCKCDTPCGTNCCSATDWCCSTTLTCICASCSCPI